MNITNKNIGKNYLIFYIPIQQSSEEEIQQAFQQLSATVNTALAESGLSEDELSKALDLSSQEEE